MIPIFIPIQSKREHSFQDVQQYRQKEPQIIVIDLCVYAVMEEGEGIMLEWLLRTFEQGAVFCYCIVLLGVPIQQPPLSNVKNKDDLSLVLISHSLCVTNSMQQSLFYLLQ
jgi:hypothetical protein